MLPRAVKRVFSLLLSVLFVLSLLPASALAEGTPGTGPIVIYHVYGGGGNSGATYKNDFVVLKNIGSIEVDISGWTLWYYSATGKTVDARYTSSFVFPSSTALGAGKYLFLKLAAGTTVLTEYPPLKADVIHGDNYSTDISVAGAAGKFALTSSGSAPDLTTLSPDVTSTIPNLVDFVGFGTTATHYLGSAPAPATSNANAILRTDFKGINATDYTAQAANAANLDYLFAPETKCSTPTATPTAGAVLTGTTVTLSSKLRDGTNLPIYYTLGVDEEPAAPTAESTPYTGPISLGSTPGAVTIKAIAINGDLEDSDIATFVYTLDDIKTIEGARSTAAGIVKTKGVITFAEYDGTYANVTIQDSTGGIVARFSSLTGGATPFTVGNELTVAGTRGTYNGLEQITLSYTDTANFTIGSAATLPAPQTVTLAQLAGSNGDAYESERVKIVGATLGAINTSGDTLLTQDSNTLNINKIPALSGIVEGNSVTVVGVLTQTAAAPTYKLRVVSASDVTLYTAIPDPITAIPDGAVDIDTALGSGTAVGASVTVVGQLVYRYGNFDSATTAILQDVIDGEIVALQIFNTLSSFQIGDVVKVTGTKALYGGVTQLSGTITSTLVEHPSLMIPAQEFETIAEVLANKADLVSEWVLIKNVKLGAYINNGSTIVSDPNNSSSTIKIYRAATYPYGVEADEIVNLYACVSKYNADDQLRVGNSTDYVVVNDTKAPLITLKTAYLDAKVNEDYVFGATIQDNVGIASATLTYSINGAPGVELNMTKNATTGDYEATIPASAITASASQIIVTINAKDAKNNAAIEKTWTLMVKNEPQVTGVTPLANTATDAVKKPLISVTFKNGGADTVAVLKLNGSAGIIMAVADNHDGTYTASYTPADDLADGKYAAEVTLTPATPGATAATYTWVFTVGEALYTAYFGQLHAHTAQYSDGSGTLADGLNYIKNISDADNVQFVAFTDHSNYFDASSAANPAEALNDISKMTSDSATKWSAYTKAMRDFNAEAANLNDIVAIPGFEMTWSGGPGHINTFNSVGLVSRNNTALNNKTADAGMKLYYDTLIQNTDPLANLSQFNHPGTTFGTFSDFAYYTPAYDSKMIAVEVGNGEGAIGAGGYYPSYTEYTKALDKGWHVAPTNNQDNHKGQWGNANTARTVILTDDLSENGLLVGLKNMTVYTTEDKNLNISYTLNDQIMGSIISEVPTANLRFAVNVNDPDGSDVISKIEVITNSGRIAESKTFTSNSAVWNFELPAAEGYYYLRVTQADMNIAVTAPVWIGQAALTGINSLECGTKLPVTGEELTLTTKLFNGESTEATLKSITYKQGETVLKSETPNTQINALSTLTHSFSFTPTVAGPATVMVTAVISSGGVDREYSQSISLKVYDSSKMVYIGIDASHYNEYVNGNYKSSMGNFTNMAVEYGVRVVELKTSEALIAATTDPHYKMIVLTPPTRRNGDAFLIGYKNYTDEEIAAVAAFAQAGNTVIVTCWGDYYEGYTKYSDGAEYTLPATDHMAAQQNKLLKALGASLRVSDDEIKNDRLNGGQAQRLYLKDYNLANPFLARVDADVQVYSNYGGSTIYAVDETGAAVATLPSSVNPMVYAFSDSYSADDDKDTYAGITIPKYDGKYMVLASETVSHANGNSSTVIVAGSCFMSNFEIQVDLDSYATPAYSNYTILENVVQSANPAIITPIADVQAEPKEGESFVIRGIVTSNASGYDKDTAFFDCIYVQDATGGINAFPVAGNVRAGQTVEIRGTTSSYEGERQIAVSKVTIIDKNISALPTPVVLTTAQAAASNSLGSLVKVSGIVTRIVLANNVVESIFVKDASGVECRVFINGYITKDKTIANLAVGSSITAVGLSSIDPQGARIRIRDRADIVCTASGGNTGSIPQTGTTVADTKTGVSATGAIPSNAVLTVSELTLPAKGQNAAADAIRKEMGRGDTVVLVAKDIKLSTSFSGKITVTLPIDAKYNGQTVVILHDNNGKLERYTAIVQNGKVSIEVTSLSPFVVLLYKGGATVPNTGDAPSQIGALLMVLAAAGTVFALRVRRGKKLER